MHAANSSLHRILEMNPKTNTKVAKGEKKKETRMETPGKNTKQKLAER